jgi:hypothetical protein
MIDRKLNNNYSNKSPHNNIPYNPTQFYNLLFFYDLMNVNRQNNPPNNSNPIYRILLLMRITITNLNTLMNGNIECKWQIIPLVLQKMDESH